MRKREVEDEIRNVFFNSVPDVLDNILKICDEKKGFDSSMKKVNAYGEKKFVGRRKIIGVCAMACVVLFCGVGLFKYNGVNEVASIVEFDVNPSVELKVNKDDDVIEAIPLNDDGKKVIGDMDFDNVDLDVVVNAIIGSMIKNGYLTVNENSILVSVKSNDVKKEKELKDDITKEIDDILKAVSIDGSILSQSFDDDKKIEKLANNYGISYGKAKLINGIVETGIVNSKGEVYTEDVLSKLSINELNILLDDKKTEVENITSNGNKASLDNYIGKDKAKEIAMSDVGVSSDNLYELEVEFDCDDGKLVYEVDFKIGNKEYEYEIDAKTGDILFKDKEIDD